VPKLANSTDENSIPDGALKVRVCPTETSPCNAHTKLTVADALAAR
jgi:hypothetical protein